MEYEMRYGQGRFADLIGKKIKALDKSEDGEHFDIHFHDYKMAHFGVDADCCSRTWIEHLEAPDDIDGATLLAVDEPDLPLHDNHECVDYGKPDSCGHDSLAVYHTRFNTNKGDIVLEYRNDSNGYYGGSLVRLS